MRPSLTLRMTCQHGPREVMTLEAVLRSSTRLTTGTMSVEMFDGSRMSPLDFLDGDVEHGGDFLPLVGRGSPAAECDRRDARFIETAALGQLGERDLLFFAKFGNHFDHDSLRAAGQETRAVQIVANQTKISRTTRAC